MTPEENILQSFYDLKRRIRELQYQHDRLKEAIHVMLDTNNSNELVTPHYSVARTFQQREYIERGEIPEELWQQYMTRISYPILHLRPR